MDLERDAAPGIHRIEDAHTNWYLVEDGDELGLVDAGVRSSWGSLGRALAALGRGHGDISSLVLTHAHFDHIGFAERVRRELGVPVWVHTDDVPLTRKPLAYGHERSRAPYLANPRAMPIVASLLRGGAFWPAPITEVRRYGDSHGALETVGSPQVVPTPGHTLGHCALHYPDRDAVIAGDAVVMLDPYTARRGPRIVAGAATADSQRNLDALGSLAETGARSVLTGHGPVWREGAEAAVESARREGPS